jgi:hypothetical protein
MTGATVASQLAPVGYRITRRRGEGAIKVMRVWLKAKDWAGRGMLRMQGGASTWVRNGPVMPLSPGPTRTRTPNAVSSDATPVAFAQRSRSFSLAIINSAKSLVYLVERPAPDG